MGRIFNKENSEDDLTDKLERLQLETQVLNAEYDKAQKEALIKEMKKKYGRGWKNVLGLAKNSETLKQMGKCHIDLV